MMLLEFASSDDAWKVSEHLHGIESIQDNWLLIDGEYYDEKAIKLAVGLANAGEYEEHCGVYKFCMLKPQPIPRDETHPYLVIADKEYYGHQMAIDATLDPEVIEEQINYMLSFSPSIANSNDPYHKPEWRIIDDYNFGFVVLNHEASLHEISLIANVVKQMPIAETAALQDRLARDRHIVLAYFDRFGVDADFSKLYRHYQGRYQSKMAFVDKVIGINAEQKELAKACLREDSEFTWEIWCGAIANSWEHTRYYFHDVGYGTVDVFAINP